MPDMRFHSLALDDAPAAHASRTWRGLIWSIRFGQVAITAVLLVIGAVRAIADGVPIPWVIATSLVFAGWYFGGLLLADRRRDWALGTWWLAGLALIWVGAVAVSPEYVWLAFPLWLLAGFILRMPWGALFSLIILVVVIVAPVFHTGTTSYANVIGPLVGGVFALGISRGYLELIRDGQERRRLVTSLMAAQEEMAQLQDELARTQRETGAGVERTRLSRDIHDTVAQSLSSIGMIARATQVSGPGPREQALKQIQELAQEALVDTRRIVNAMMPAELEGSALGEALRRMLSRMQDETGVRAELHVDDSFPALPVAAEVTLLRTAQSALANVRAHANAGRVVVNLIDAGDSVRLDVVDDGVGFDVRQWNAKRPRRDGGGYGLRAMKARLRELGGGLDVESTPGEGTALSAFIPLKNTGDYA